MATSALTPPLTDAAPQEVLIEFPDNRLLIDLCGEHDRNLVDIEAKLGVQIVRRGNQLSILGDTDSQQQASDVLTSLYARLEGGRDVDSGDIDREVRMGGSEQGTGTRDGDQLEMFRVARSKFTPAKSWLNPEQKRKRPMSSPCSKTNWHSGSGLRVRAKPIWLLLSGFRCSSAGRWIASSCLVLRSKQVRNSAISPVT